MIALINDAAGRLRGVSSSPRLDAELLFCFTAGISRETLIARGEDFVSPAITERFEEVVARRERGEPMAYITGRKEFYGRAFRVNRNVLIPRPETELLVEVALREASGMAPPVSVLDLGTGSGCIAISLFLELKARGIEAHVTATDICERALSVARENASSLEAPVRFIHSPWYFELNNAEFDIIVSNPPYIAENDPQLDPYVRMFEPPGALFADDKGLSAVKGIVTGFREHRTPRGVLFAECGYGQKEEIEDWIRGHVPGGVNVRWFSDFNGRDRVFGILME